MSRLIFATMALIGIGGALRAQQVPGRDLLEFPVGALAEAPALSVLMTGSIWNPAASALSRSQQSAFGFAGLTTPQEQGVRLEMGGASYRLRQSPTTLSVSFAQASVADILKTETDPQSLGGEIPYETMLISAGVSTTRGNVKAGLAGRYRWGTVDTERDGRFALDGGFIVDGIVGTPVRVGASTFLFSPASGMQEASYMAVADLPLVRRDSTLTVRGGYSLMYTNGQGRESYAFATSAYRQIDLSGGMSETNVYGHVARRLRLGFGLHYSGYNIAIGREDGATGFGASYQFLFTRAFPR